MTYNFDEVIDRKNSNSMNVDGWREYIFHAPRDRKFPFPDDEYVRMWIADMEFGTPDCIIDAMKERLAIQRSLTRSITKPFCIGQKAAMAGSSPKNSW